MTTAQVLSLVLAQTWQVAVLSSIVWLVVRYATRERSHLSHMLWTLVLIKCLTPPVWSSPVGLFSRWSPTPFLNQPNNGYGLSIKTPSTMAAPGISIVSSIIPPSIPTATELTTSARTGKSADWRPTIVSVWLGGAALFASVALIRFFVFQRQIRWTTVATPPEVARCVKRLSKQLRLRQKVGVRVVTSSVGPAVYGLLRPVIVLPQAIVMGKAESQLEPLIAHEMIHVRRGDLLVALIQSLACNLAWFHPMVWFASRCVTIESERCCDEETIASLQCKPSIYARSLLDVLERKHLLRVAPALPGVRPVDITLARLERIMRLGQGSRRRSPWWVWCAALACGIAVLPGAHYVGAQPPEPSEQQEKSSKLITDTRKQGERILEKMRLENPTGRLADDKSESNPKPLPFPAAPATAPFKFDAKADGDKSTLLMEVEIFEVGANSSAEKELTLWLEKQSTGSNSEAFKRITPVGAIKGTTVSDPGVVGEFRRPERSPEAGSQDQTNTQAVPILSKIPYINRLFPRESNSSNSQSDGSVVQASAQSAWASKQLEFVTPASEAVDSFTTSMKKLDTVKTLSRPQLFCESGQTAMVSVKENTSTEPSAGFSLSLKPIELRNGNLILDYSKSTTTKANLDSTTTAASTSSRDTKPASFRTRQTMFSTSVDFGQSLVVVSRGAEENASHEVVVIKCTKRDQPN